MRTLILALLLSVSFSAQAIEFTPYPTKKITTEQWQSYFDAVNSAYGSSREENSKEHVIYFTALVGDMYFIFTQPGHPAHPAWVARRRFYENGSTNVQLAGYFAGAELPFQDFFRQYVTQAEEASRRVKENQANNWTGSAEQESTARRVAEEYFSACDSRDYRHAYRMFSSSFQKNLSFEEWRAIVAQFNEIAGPVKVRTLKKVSWYKNPPQGPLPGIYVALDYESRFENIDEHSGFVALHLEDDGTFRITREEATIKKVKNRLGL